MNEKKNADARKGGKVAKHCVFPMVWGYGGSKSRLAKAAGAEPAGQMWDEKLYAVARNACRSQNVQNTPGGDHFWKLRFHKSARRCGAKHMSKSKCTKHTSFGPLLEVEMSKKCTPLWREAHFEVKMHKAHHVRTTVGLSELVSRGRRKGLCTLSNVSKTWGVLWHFQLQPPLRHTTLQYTTPQLQLHLHYVPLHYILHYTHYTPPHSTPLQYTTLHYNQLRPITPHYITPHSTPPHHTTLHHTTAHYTTLHSATLNSTPLHNIPLHYSTLHCTARHYTSPRRGAWDPFPPAAL